MARKVCAAYNRILMSEAVVIVVISIQAYVLSRPVVNVLYTHFTATNVCSYILCAMFAYSQNIPHYNHRHSEICLRRLCGYGNYKQSLEVACKH